MKVRQREAIALEKDSVLTKSAANVQDGPLIPYQGVKLVTVREKVNRNRRDDCCQMQEQTLRRTFARQHRAENDRNEGNKIVLNSIYLATKRKAHEFQLRGE